MQPAVEKKRKRRFAEESTDDEDDDDDDDDSDLDGQDDLDADGKGRRKSRRAAGPAMRRSDRASANVAAVAAAVAASNGAQDTASSLGSEVPSRIVIATNRPKPLRLLRETEHAYEQILLCKHDMFASVKEVLVPVKLEFELDGMRVRDTITWNLNDVLVTPVMFARYLQQDLELSDEQTHRIAGMIAVQLEEHRRFFEMFDVPAPEDTRVLIKLNIRSGKVLLRDRFEWDLSSGLTPEEFARHMVMDLRLGGEFVQLIAWSIRDQLHRIRRDGEFEPTFAIEQPFRAEEEARSWSPRVEITLAQSEDEEEEVDMAKERASRRIRREQRTNATSRRRPAYPGVADAASYSIYLETTGELPEHRYRMFREIRIK
nr:SWI SNF, matrix associated, actin dependent regulator of chromatin, sub b, member 1 [Polyrhizophydium stewartii]